MIFLDYYFIRQVYTGLKCFLVLVTVCFHRMEKAVRTFFKISPFQTPHCFAELSKAPSSDVVLCQKALRSNSLICLVGRSEGWKTDRTLLSLILNHDSTAHTFLSLFSPPNHSNDQRPAPKQNIHTALGTGPRPLGSRVMSELFINVDSTSHFVFCVRSKLHWDRNGPNVQILQ